MDLVCFDFEVKSGIVFCFVRQFDRFLVKFLNDMTF